MTTSLVFPLLLLTGLLVNSAASAAFLDLSPNNFTISQAGAVGSSVTVGYSVASNIYSPFSGAGGSAVIINSSALGAPTSSVFNFGAGNYTIEAFVYPYSTGRMGVVSIGNGTAYDTVNVYVTGNGGVEVTQASGTSGYDLQATYGTAGTIPVNRWTHIAVVRQAGTVKVFANGTQIGNAFNQYTSRSLKTNNRVRIGAIIGGGVTVNYFSGRISNVRIVAGTAVYTGSYTVPSSPLGAISGTQLLLGLSGTPTQVTGLTASDSTSASAIRLDWTAVPAASSYNVYVSGTATGTYTLLGSTANNYYDHSGLATGTTKFYKVSAVNSDGEGSQSAYDQGTTASPPNQVAGVTATQGTVDNAVRLNWTSDPLATSYDVYRSTASGTQGTLITNLALNSYQDDGATGTTIYYYTIVARNTYGPGTASTQVSGYANIPPSSASATITAMIGGADVVSNPSITDANAAAGQTENFTYSILTQPASGQGTVSIDAGTGKPKYSPPASGSGFSTSFTFRVADKAGATVDGVANVTVSGVPGQVNGLSATQGTVNGAVTLNWTAEDAATSYEIRRSVTPGGPYALIGTSTLPFYTDSAVSGVTAYEYTVAARNSVGPGVTSTPATGWANVGPTMATAALTVEAGATSDPSIPTVTDPNTSAGQSDSFGFTITSQPAHGMAAVIGGALVYTANAGYEGGDSFTFGVTDQGGLSTLGTATVAVTAPPAPAGGGCNSATPEWNGFCFSYGNSLLRKFCSRESTPPAHRQIDGLLGTKKAIHLIE